MELLLNLTWLTIAAVLGVLLLASRSRCQSRCKTASAEYTSTRSTAWLCYLILIALLLPAISMTDDMMAMVAPTDGEQIARRYEVSGGGQHHADFHVALFYFVRDFSQVPLVCIGVLETSPEFRSHYSSPRQDTQGRAPPVIS
jgi:hypothetical protein